MESQVSESDSANSLSSTPPKTFRVLSIDGGGIKGLYSAKILERFESTFDCRLADYFDLVCGTSTGGLIALGISLNIPMQEISQFYCDEGSKIFPSKNARLGFLKQIFWRSKYDSEELKTALTKIFGDRILADSNCLLCIPAFSLTDGRPFIFKYDHVEGNLSRDNKTRYVDIALATSAAPTYFPIVSLSAYDYKQFIDGGIYANNPTLIGVVEALRYFVGKGNQFQKLQVMSVASLEPVSGRRLYPNHQRSALSWNKDLITAFSEGQSGLTSYMVDTLANHCDAPFDYVRIPSTLLSSEKSKVVSIDNSSEESLRLMAQMGNEQALLWEKKPEVASFFQKCKQYTIR